ncbi:transketolase family protein [Paraglaciecola sp.]|uniref:transketolase family protein n=1 Tax=Paraglaciecola sp. TaxID=1920173 RepID=UPI003EF2FD6B
MRNQFAKCITEAAKIDESVILLYADIGNRLFNDLKVVAPERTINAGIAEANMATMAAGLAMEGFKPVIYTITPFTTARNFEQIKVDIAYQNQGVVIVGTGSGLSYANLGPTHHSFEDIALMRVLPNMQVVCPADKVELEGLFKQALSSSSPVYLRIGKKNEPTIYENGEKFTIGKAHVLDKGLDVCLLVNGTILPIVIEVKDRLEALGKSCELVSMHTVKPLDSEYLKDAMCKFDLIVTVEEHSLVGGFGSAIAEWIVDGAYSKRLIRFGIEDKFIDQVGSQASARQKTGLTVDNITQKITEAVGL